MTWGSRTNALIGISLLLTASAVPADGEGWNTYWKNGTRIESEDGEFKIKLGGRVQADFSAASSRDFSVEDGSEFRRARLFVEGTLYHRFEFKAQYDFAGGDAEPKDVYLGITDIPYVGGIRVGHFKEPFGLEQLTSSKYLAFLERSINDESLTESRNMGLMLHHQVLGERLTWALGAFQPSDGFASYSGSEWNLTGRITGLPIWQDDGRRLLHLGLALSERDPADGTVRLRSRPEAHLAPRLVDTGSLAADALEAANVELALVEGPLWVHSEYTTGDVDTVAGESLTFSGYNIQAGYYLTGEHRRFKTSSATFDRQTPKRPFLEERGIGAWEIAARFSSLDLNDAPVAGGELESLTFAVNWYPNPATRVMLNYINAELKDGRDAELVLLRFQVDF